MPRLPQAALIASIVVVPFLSLVAGQAQAESNDPYTACALRPQAPACAMVYHQALKNDVPGAIAVRQAFDHYARYVESPSSGLTQADRRYLKDNQIDMPPNLNSKDLNGVHNVIHDPALQSDPDAKRGAVNNFISRALQAELYCDFNTCTSASGGASPRLTGQQRHAHRSAS